MEENQQAALARLAILQHREAEQARLDADAAKARADHISALRRACTEGVEPSDPVHAVCTLVALTVTVGRDDGCPDVSLPDSTRKIVKAAMAAGLIDPGPRIGTTLWCDGVIEMREKLPEHRADFDAWFEATNYRKAQARHPLA